MDGLIAQHADLKAMLREEQTQLEARAPRFRPRAVRPESREGPCKGATCRQTKGRAERLARTPPAPTQGRVMAELRALEEEAARLGSGIEGGAAAKRQLLAGAAPPCRERVHAARMSRVAASAHPLHLSLPACRPR